MSVWKAEEMTRQELNRLNRINAMKMPYAARRTSGWKLWTGSEWLHGLHSLEQGRHAMEHRSSPEESHYVKADEWQDSSFGRANVHF